MTEELRAYEEHEHQDPTPICQQLIHSKFPNLGNSQNPLCLCWPSHASLMFEDGSRDETLSRQVLIAPTVFLRGGSRTADLFVHALMLSRRESAFGSAHSVWRAVSGHDELASFDLLLVFEDTIFWNSGAVQGRA